MELLKFQLGFNCLGGRNKLRCARDSTAEILGHAHFLNCIAGNLCGIKKFKHSDFRE